MVSHTHSTTPARFDHAHFRLQVVYQVGVLISRSSVSLYHFKHFWILAVLQVKAFHTSHQHPHTLHTSHTILILYTCPMHKNTGSQLCLFLCCLLVPVHSLLLAHHAHCTVWGITGRRGVCECFLCHLHWGILTHCTCPYTPGFYLGLARGRHLPLNCPPPLKHLGFIEAWGHSSPLPPLLWYNLLMPPLEKFLN